MSNKLSYPPLYDTLQQLKSEIFKGLRVCVPGSIAAVNASSGTVDVTVGLMQNIPVPGTPKGLPASYPTLTMCPVFTLQGGGVGAVMPIAIGDECLVIFSDRCISTWFQTGQPNPLPDFRMHDISDGFALVGLNSSDTPHKLVPSISAGEGGICETKTSIGARIVIDPVTHKLKLANATTDLLVVIDGLIDVIKTLTTVGGPTTQAISPASQVILESYKTIVSGLLYS